MKQYNIFLPDDVVKEIDEEVRYLKENKPEGAPKNIGRGTVLTQLWYRHRAQSQRKT